MNVLVLSPHTDDGELGCGGAMARLAEEGHRVCYAAFSKGTAVDREMLGATRLLGVEAADALAYRYATRLFPEKRQAILQDIIGLRERFLPELVFCPSPRDRHQDHQVVAAEAQRAFKDVSLLGYELPWNNRSFQTDCFFKLRRQHVKQKVSALSCYASQRDRPYMRPEFVWSLAAVRGVLVGGFAEAFEVVRWVY